MTSHSRLSAWSHEDLMIRKHGGLMPTARLAQMLGLSEGSVRRRAAAMRVSLRAWPARPRRERRKSTAMDAFLGRRA